MVRLHFPDFSNTGSRRHYDVTNAIIDCLYTNVIKMMILLKGKARHGAIACPRKTYIVTSLMSIVLIDRYIAGPSL